MRTRPQLLLRQYLADQTNIFRRLRTHALVVAEQRDAHDITDGNAVTQADWLHRTDESVGDMRIEELRILGAEDDVGFIEKIKCAAATQPVHRDDQWLEDIIGFGAEFGAGVLHVPDIVVAEDVFLLARSEEHTSELQSREKLVCRLLLEKKN